MQITTESGPSFFIRPVYLSLLSVEQLVCGAQFLEQEEDELINAGFCFAAEQKALDYLNRSEQYRLGLTSKLLAKSFDKNHINQALDYLESKKYLDDRRFARMWLNNRKINHAEGRSKLFANLCAKGISKEFINSALDDFFNENSEEEICLRALKKCKRLKKSEEQIITYLLKNGFSVKLYQRVKEIYGTEEN